MANGQVGVHGKLVIQLHVRKWKGEAATTRPHLEVDELVQDQTSRQQIVLNAILQVNPYL